MHNKAEARQFDVHSIDGIAMTRSDEELTLTAKRVNEQFDSQQSWFSGYPEQFTLELDECRQIDIDAVDTLAQRLTSYPAQVAVSLNGLISLLERDARQLASTVSDDLYLDGLECLADGVAAALSGHSHGMLSLDGLTTLSRNDAAETRLHPGPVRLSGLTKLDDEVATALAANRHGDLFLSGLRSLSPASAEALGVHTGCLDLSGLTSIPDDVAASLGRHRGSLKLDGLTSLSVVAAKYLAGNNGDLSLNGLVDVQDDSLIALAGHETGTLYLDGLTTLSEPAGEALRHHRGVSLSLRGITELSDQVVQSLAKKKGQLDLSGMHTLSDSAAAHLASHEGSLVLRDLKTLTDDGARALAQHRGSIYSRHATLEQEIESQRVARRSRDQEIAAQSLASLDQSFRQVGHPNSGPKGKSMRGPVGTPKSRRSAWISILAGMLAVSSVVIISTVAVEVDRRTLTELLARNPSFIAVVVILALVGLALWTAESRV